MRFSEHQWREMDREWGEAEDRRAMARERLAKWRAFRPAKKLTDLEARLLSASNGLTDTTRGN
jgi:hypothetical protein